MKKKHLFLQGYILMNYDSYLSPEEIAFIDRASRAPFLSPEEEKVYALSWRDRQDEKAKARLVESHLRLVISLAKKRRNYGHPLLDVVGEGMIGLMEAINRFDPESDVRFATYASYWINSFIYRYVFKNASSVKIATSSDNTKLFFNLNRVKKELTQNRDTPLSPEQIAIIAQKLNVSKNSVGEMEQRLKGGDVSLNSKVGGAESSDDDPEKQDLLVDQTPDQEEKLGDRQEEDIRLKMLAAGLEMAGLSEREQSILSDRNLLESPLTLQQLSIKHNISRERVRQIEQKAFEALQIAIKKLAAMPLAKRREILACTRQDTTATQRGGPR